MYISIHSSTSVQIRKLFEPKIVMVFLTININMFFGFSKEPSHLNSSFGKKIRKLFFDCVLLSRGLQVSVHTHPFIDQLQYSSYLYIAVMLCINVCLLSFRYMSRRAWWLRGRVLDLRLSSCMLEPHWRHCIVCLNKSLYPVLSTG